MTKTISLIEYRDRLKGVTHMTRVKELPTVEQSKAAYRGLPVLVVAERLSCSVGHVLTLIHSKKLAAINIGVGKRPEYRINEPDLQRYIESAAA